MSQDSTSSSSRRRPLSSELHVPSGDLHLPPGIPLIPDDFPQRLTRLKEMTGLSWERVAVALGVDPRQLLRWRLHGGTPSGGPMLSIVRLAARVPGGLAVLLDEDVTVIFNPRR